MLFFAGQFVFVFLPITLIGFFILGSKGGLRKPGSSSARPCFTIGFEPTI